MNFSNLVLIRYINIFNKQLNDAFLKIDLNAKEKNSVQLEEKCVDSKMLN